MTNIKFNPKTFTLDIKGHAGKGKKGEDIVCSAISTLFYTLMQTLIDAEHMMEEGISITVEDGNGHISCKPKKEYEANVSLIFLTILNGFNILAENQKKYVKFKVVG